MTETSEPTKRASKVSRRTFSTAAVAAGVTGAAYASTQASPSPKTGGNIAVEQLSTPGASIDYLFPLTEEPVTFRILATTSTQIEDLETNAFTAWYEEKTNVKLEWEIVSAEEATTALNVRLTGDDLPDIIMGFSASLTPELLQLYGSQGIFQPLNAHIDEHGKEIARAFNEYSLFKSSITAADGNIYAFPELNDCFHCQSPAKLWVYKPWLDKLGLAIPTTVDEYHALLTAIKDQDPNGDGANNEIPLTTWIAPTQNAGTFPDYLMNSFGYAPRRPRLLLNAEGAVAAAYTTDYWKAGVKWMAQLYAEGLIPPEALIQDQTQLRGQGNNPDAPIIGSVPGLYPGQFMDIDSVGGGRWTEYVAIPPLAGPDGYRQAAHYPYDAFIPDKIVITSACERPDIAVKWCDAFYNLEITMRSQEGNLDEHWRWATPDEVGIDGKPAIWKRLVSWDGSQNFCWRQHAPSYRSSTFRLGEATLPEDADNSLEPILYRESKNNYEPYWHADEWVVPPLFFSAEDSNILADAGASIDLYVEQTVALAIAGQFDIEGQWEEYLGTLEQMGLPALLDAYQRTYDASKTA
jgi:putative aldouronate transport system substrate-binding protein